MQGPAQFDCSPVAAAAHMQTILAELLGLLTAASAQDKPSCCTASRSGCLHSAMAPTAAPGGGASQGHERSCRDLNCTQLPSRLALECMAVAELAQRGPIWTWQTAAEQAGPYAQQLMRTRKTEAQRQGPTCGGGGRP